MSARASLRTVLGQERVNFLLTNRIPRHALTRFMGWFSKIELPPVRAASIALWRLFCDVDLGDARDARFRSLHAAFIRELRPEARLVDPDPAVIASPCDAIVGAFGRIEAGTALQVKGMPYPIADLLGSGDEAAAFEGGWYVTLRLTAGMYHRFHAPHDVTVEQLRYISGDTWNVNPAALRRIERLYCKNERALLELDLGRAAGLLLVPVAAILDASIRLNCLTTPLKLTYRGPNRLPCDAAYAKGDEMGWFEHGSTILVFGTKHFALCDGVRDGARIEMGRPLLREL